MPRPLKNAIAFFGKATIMNSVRVDVCNEAALNAETSNGQKRGCKRKRQKCEEIGAAFQEASSLNKVLDALKEQVVQHAMEVVPGGRGKGGTRGTHEASRKYGVSCRTVRRWLKAQESRFVKVFKSEGTDAFKEKVVQYALEVVPGGSGKGGTRGAYAAARKFGVPQQTLQRWVKTQQSGFVKVSKSEITAAFKEKVVQYALEVVPGGRAKGGTRGCCEAARKYGVSNEAVNDWLKAKECGFVRVSKSKITDSFREKVVKYALQVVPGGKGKGGTRGTCEAGRKYGVAHQTVHEWLKAKESRFVKTGKNEATDAFKAEVVQYALEVVPGGNGTGGTRGTYEAGLVYGVSQETVRRWSVSGLWCKPIGEKSLSTQMKSEIVKYALDAEVITGNDLTAITNASKKFSVEPAIIKGWIRHFQRSQNNHTGQHSKAPSRSLAPEKMTELQRVPYARIQPVFTANEMEHKRPPANQHENSTCVESVDVEEDALQRAVVTKQEECYDLLELLQNEEPRPAIWGTKEKIPESKDSAACQTTSAPVITLLQVPSPFTSATSDKANPAELSLPQGGLHLLEKVMHLENALHKKTQENITLTKEIQLLHRKGHIAHGRDSRKKKMQDKNPKSKASAANKKNSIPVATVFKVPNLAKLSSPQKNTSKCRGANKQNSVLVTTVSQVPGQSTSATSDKPNLAELRSPQAWLYKIECCAN